MITGRFLSGQNFNFAVGFILVMAGMFINSDFSILIISGGFLVVLLGAGSFPIFRNKNN